MFEIPRLPGAPGRQEALLEALFALERELDALLFPKLPAEAPSTARRSPVPVRPEPSAKRVSRPSRGRTTPPGSSIGPRIRALRLERGLTQQQLSEATGIRRPNVARLEKGDSTPTIETVQKIASALGVAAASLLA